MLNSFTKSKHWLESQAGPFGEANVEVKIPGGLLLDENGDSISHAEFAPSDILTLVMGLAAATFDIVSGHQNYTFNNLLACLICCDILQVCNVLLLHLCCNGPIRSNYRLLQK